MLDPIQTSGGSAPEATAPVASSATVATVPSLGLRHWLLGLLRQESQRWFALLAAVEFVLLGVLAQSIGVLAVRLPPSPWFAGSTMMKPQLWAAPVFAATVCGSLLVLGLYQRHRREVGIGAPSVLVRVGLALSTSWLLLNGLEWLAPEAGLVSRPLRWLLPLSAVVIVASRFVFARSLALAGLKRRILLLGAGQRAATALGRMRRDQDRRGVDLVGCVPLPGEPIAVERVRLLAPLANLPQRALAERIEEIVVAVDDRRGALPMKALLQCREAGIAVIEVEDFCERELGKVNVELVRPSWFVFSQLGHGLLLRRLVKRGFDLATAFALLVVTAPLMGLVAVAILLESRGRGPVLYVQERVGANDRCFRLYKFRSMRTDAEMDGVARWASADDARVTRVGRFIRKARLDELPQLWNVLRGEMSIVGPRPERPQFVARFKQNVPYYSLRHSVSPGLTGWAQLRFPYGASEADAVEKLRYDLYYVKHHGLTFDLLVLLQTVEVVLFGRGAR